MKNTKNILKISKTEQIFRLSKKVGNSPAVTRLHSMFPRSPSAPEYKITSVRGPDHMPVFTMVCTVDNKSFAGEGNSKKEAKISCSQKALEAITGQKQQQQQQQPGGLGGVDKGHGFWGHLKPPAAPTTSPTPRQRCTRRRFLGF